MHASGIMPNTHARISLSGNHPEPGPEGGRKRLFNLQSQANLSTHDKFSLFLSVNTTLPINSNSIAMIKPLWLVTEKQHMEAEESPEGIQLTAVRGPAPERCHRRRPKTPELPLRWSFPFLSRVREIHKHERPHRWQL